MEPLPFERTKLAALTLIVGGAMIGMITTYLFYTYEKGERTFASALTLGERLPGPSADSRCSAQTEPEIFFVSCGGIF